MSFVGNKEGHKKPDIARKLGPDYFGITAEQLEAEIQRYPEDEVRGIVDPVDADKNGRHFIIFNAPDSKIQKFYLEENGYHINGNTKKNPGSGE